MASFSSPRLKKLKSSLVHNHLDGVIVTKKENLRYLTGLHTPHPTQREAVLYLNLKSATLYHSAFLHFNPPLDITAQTFSPTKQQEIVNTLFPSGSNIAVEAHDLTLSEYHRYQDLLPQTNLLPHNNLVESLRLTKENTEIKFLQRSGQIAAKVMQQTLDYLRQKAGSIYETDVVYFIKQHFLNQKVEDLAFPIIVAADANSALPHHQPNVTPITKKSVVLIDFGCKVEGYCSDLTRTICLGTPPPKFKEIETTVHQAYQAALDTLTSSTNPPSLDKKEARGSLTTNHHNTQPNHPPTAANLDQAARKVIENAGYGQSFTHTTGHGLGLEIHEQPSLNNQNHQPITPNMAFTIEPGIYLPGTFGYRHENTILTTPPGPTTLTT